MDYTHTQEKKRKGNCKFLKILKKEKSFKLLNKNRVHNIFQNED